MSLGCTCPGMPENRSCGERKDCHPSNASVVSTHAATLACSRAVRKGNNARGDQIEVARIMYSLPTLMPNLAFADGALARRATVQLFLGTGEYDPKFPAWSGNIIERETKAMADMLQALVAEVKKRSGRIHAPSFPADLVAFTRKKVEPMVRGLFRRDEQEAVLAVLEKSLVFLTAANVEQVLLGCTWPHTWSPGRCQAQYADQGPSQMIWQFLWHRTMVPAGQPVSPGYPAKFPLSSTHAPVRGPRSHCSPYLVSRKPSPQQDGMPALSPSADASGGSRTPPSDQVPLQIPPYGVCLHLMDCAHHTAV
jgi:hypothetical protein